jgi:hypothetical protein
VNKAAQDCCADFHARVGRVANRDGTVASDLKCAARNALLAVLAVVALATVACVIYGWNN